MTPALTSQRPRHVAGSSGPPPARVGPEPADDLEGEPAMNKKNSKKLTLSAETLRNLTEPDLQQVAGQSAKCSAVVCSATNVCSNCRPCL